MDDFLQSLGGLCLGSRLKRAGVAVQAATQAWLDRQGFPVPATHLPVMEALHRRGALPVGTLAAMLGIAQPGVTRMSAQLEAGGWVVSGSSGADRRVREIRLTEKGEDLVRCAGETLWPAVSAVVGQLCYGIDGDFLAGLSALEDRLAAGLAGELFARAEPAGEDAP